MSTCGILLSCEHGGYEVPPAYLYLFAGRPEALYSHRGWDPGTLLLGQYLAEALSLPLVFSTTTRLLIELNRSLENDQLFSEFGITLTRQEKEVLILQYYMPYREALQREIELYHQAGKSCAHFSLHSFTPIWYGRERLVDIGLLFDPERSLENDLCQQLMKRLQRLLPDMRVRFNEPYLGTDDGLTTFLRTRYDDTAYAGIEIEINQKWVESSEMKRIHKALKDALGRLI